MKKKLLSALLAVCLCSNIAQPAAYRAEAPDLAKLASSFGADSDFLNIPNYCYTPELHTGTITGYSYESIIPVDEYVELESGSARYSDASFGISVMEMLAHNGLISPDDIKPGAESLREITDSEELRSMITSVQSILDMPEFRFLENYAFKSKSADDKIPELIATAEKACAENSYFLLMYGSYNKYPTELEKSMGMDGEGSRVQKVHSAVGIGITDGEWSFGGRIFDKCILTLDSFNVSENSGAFSEDTCIYINSETGNHYIPAYSDSVESDLHIIAIDESDDIDTTDIVNVTMTHKNSYSKYEITASKDGKDTVLNADNDYLDYYHNPYNGNLFIKADKLTIDRESYSEVDLVTISKYDSFAEIELKKADSTIEFDGSSYTLIRKPNSEYPEAALNYSLFLQTENGGWDFYGDTMSSVSFTPYENGIIVDGNGSAVSARFAIGSGDPRKNIYASDKVLILKGTDGNFSFMIDRDNDGVYESEVQTGDVDCDGQITAVDASLILSDYASSSVGDDTLLNSQLADYNNDGIIDAIDASQVLAEYARLSTT